MPLERLAHHALRAQAENIADSAEQGRPDGGRDGIQDDEARHGHGRQACGDTADQPHAVDVAVGQHEDVGMGVEQAVGAAEARPPAQPPHIAMLGEAAAEGEEERVAGEGAEEGGHKSLPQHEDVLMSEETAKDRGTFAFGDAAQEDRDQPVLLNEMMDGPVHSMTGRADSLSSMRLICSAMRRISSRMPMISLWRSSSSFSCRAMISISAFRLTS